ncbi:MAG: cation:proton antiporter [Clostridia bacterium]|nr:cation:proton antiporter [Clostridia bacterium]
MLLSIALIFLIGLLFGKVFAKIKLPPLFGMIIAGIIIGPFVLNRIDDSILNVSSEIRKIALIIILIRAGLSLDISDLKKAGCPALLLCFLPACFEITGMVLIAPALMNVSRTDAAIMGAVVAAVSPAVIVPRMIKLIDEGYGKDKSIPQMILAGASVDDVFVIVIFTVFTGLAQGEKISVVSFLNIPISIFAGIVTGIIVGVLLSLLFSKFIKNSTVQTIVLLSFSMLLTATEDMLPEFIPFASLIAVMVVGIVIKNKQAEIASDLKKQYNSLWTAAEVFLFVLVGASVDIHYAASAGLTVVFVVLGALLVRITGVAVCLVKTNLSFKERLFCMIAYTPKATVQAAIGGIPLSMGLSCGNTVLTVAVMAILITAPIGAFGIDYTYKKLLKKQ